MNANPQNFTRREWVKTLANGASDSLDPQADYWYVQSVVNGSGVAQTVKVDVNGQRANTPVGAGQGGQGQPGRGDMQRLLFTNNTGADVTITIIFGNGQANFAGLVQIQSGTLDLSAASIATLAAAILNPITLVPFAYTVGAVEDGGTIVSPLILSNLKGVYIYNNGPNPTNLDYGATDEDLGASDEADFSVENDADKIGDITITVPAGSTCFVRGLKYPA